MFIGMIKFKFMKNMPHYHSQVLYILYAYYITFDHYSKQYFRNYFVILEKRPEVLGISIADYTEILESKYFKVFLKYICNFMLCFVRNHFIKC